MASMATFTLGSQPLLDPRHLYAECLRQGLDTSWYGTAFAFRCPLGCEPGRGRVLMTREALEALDLGELHDLVITVDQYGAVLPAGLPANWDGTLTLKSLLVTSYKSLTPGLRDDPTEALLVEVVDKRHLYQNIPINVSYNVLTVPDGDYYTATISGGVTAYT